MCETLNGYQLINKIWSQQRTTYCSERPKTERSERNLSEIDNWNDQPECCWQIQSAKWYEMWDAEFRSASWYCQSIANSQNKKISQLQAMLEKIQPSSMTLLTSTRSDKEKVSNCYRVRPFLVSSVTPYFRLFKASQQILGNYRNSKKASFPWKGPKANEHKCVSHNDQGLGWFTGEHVSRCAVRGIRPNNIADNGIIESDSSMGAALNLVVCLLTVIVKLQRARHR